MNLLLATIVAAFGEVVVFPDWREDFKSWNAFAGVAIGFMLWSLFAWWLLYGFLHFYDGSRLPDKFSDLEDKETVQFYNRRKITRLSLCGGLIVGAFWYTFIHHNPLISN